MTNININEVAQEFTQLLNDWHSQPEAWDSDIDRQIHRWYGEVGSVFPKRPYFSPSSAKTCPRELYMKQMGAKKDGFLQPPHKGRWQRIGTNVGDMIQRDLLFIEKHYESKTGKVNRFSFERDMLGRPMFEDFAKKNKEVNHRGHKFYLFGLPDGIMRYVTEDGEEVRIGLEVKSKQTSYSRTSLYSMKGPDEKHISQTVAYSEMYGVDYYIILYVNASKKGWEYSDEDFAKSPDIRAFGIEITEEDRLDLFDELTVVLDAVRDKKPPTIDLSNWTFNNFKTACAASLSDEEFDAVKNQVRMAMRSGLRENKKQDYVNAFEFIKEVREKSEGEAR